MAYINKINVDGVEYEVQDENALPAADLPEAINTALAQAKESGEFDGPQGPAGESGVYVGTDTPPEGTKVWVNPNGVATFPMPTADDAGKVLKAKGANEAEWGDAPSGGGYKDMTLLAEVDCSQSSGNIELTGLDNIEEIYVLWDGVMSAHESTNSGYQLEINGGLVAPVGFVPIFTASKERYGWSYAKYNGFVWLFEVSSGAISNSIRMIEDTPKTSYNHGLQGLGRATELRLISPSVAYLAVSGTIKIYGR